MKEFLSHHNIDYKEFNVQADEQARNDMIKKYDSMSTPTIVVDGEVVIGFDADKLSGLLNINE